MEGTEIKIIDASVEVIEAQNRAEYDIQISTAKKYPRNLQRVKDNCVAIVTMDKSTAESCRYALPRGGKTLSGPTVHLARIIAQQYGNIRVDARVKQITDTQVISEAVCFDLETNYASKIEVRRSIMGKTGRFNDDMIVVTGNAANAIAYRNAIFSVIPFGITDACYNASIRTVTGDLTSEDKLIKRRTEVVDYFKTTYNVTEAQVLGCFGFKSITAIKAENIADYASLKQALIDKDTTPEEVFSLTRNEKPNVTTELKNSTFNPVSNDTKQ